MGIIFGSRRRSRRRTGGAVLLALIHVILVLAGRGCFEALTIDKVKLRKVCECSIGEGRSMWGPDISQDMILRTPKNPSFSSRRSTSQSVHYHTTQGYNQGGDIEYGRRWYMTYHLLELEKTCTFTVTKGSLQQTCTRWFHWLQ